MTATTQWLNEPRQTRSEKTLRSILDAAEELLSEGYFERATVQEVVRRANVSVGAFYSRFQDKEALFHILHERLLSDVADRIAEITAPERHSGSDLRTVVHSMVRDTAATYSERRGVLRALALYARGDCEPVFAERAQRVNRIAMERIEALLIQRTNEIRHPSPATAIRVGIIMMTSSLRELFVFGEAGMSPVDFDQETVCLELSQAWLAYLGSPPLEGR